MRRAPRACLVALLALSLAVLLPCPAVAQDRLTFIGVALDVETRQADKKLQELLYQRAGVSFAPEELEYERVIDRLANWRKEDGFFLARATPYVYVVAEMLGARFEVLASYVSTATRGRTYHSYFVVNRRAFPAQPTLPDLIRFLGERREGARFVYHNQFSTSSYFLPSLYFRANRIFNMSEPTESLTAISSARVAGGSSTLVELVARGEADLAAVWDGTKSKLEAGAAGTPAGQLARDVYFVQLPTPLPNDLLVCSAALDPPTKERLRAAIRGMGAEEIGIGDFATWQSITETSDARLALADLRWLARERVAPATVDIALAPGVKASAATSVLVEAARQAVRLAGTELILFDQDFHEHIDFAWSLEPIHDGAVILRSTIPGSGIDDQVFRLSFRDGEDLTKRIVTLMQTRLHRIRAVWPYSGGAPIVIRDMAFSVPEGTVVKVQRISWLDPERNKFRAGPLFGARIRACDFYTYRLEVEDFAQPGEPRPSFDAMSNVSYRVILLRTSQDRPIFRAVTLILLGLLVLVAVALVVDLRRARPGQGDEDVLTRRVE